MICPDDNQVAAFAAGALPTDEALAVDVHIDGCAPCRELVSEAMRDATPADAPERLGRYEVLELLGRGGMGAVYRAHDPDLSRHVAIKVFHQREGEASPTQRERQLREARALARVAHPNVVSVHDVGTVDGAVFMAMELVDGEPFDRWWRRERSIASPATGGARSNAQRCGATIDQLVEIARQVGAGLAAAHAAGLVHGDVTPANLIVTPEDRVVVVDFGLSTAPDAAADGGTPGYMAPEQEHRGALDARTDQYGLCATLFEALFGRRPEPGESRRRGRSGEIPAGGTLVQGSPRVPARVLAAIRRGLDPDPAARFATMGELVAELAPCRTRRVALAIGGAGVLAAIASVAWRTAAGSPPEPPRVVEQASRAALPMGLVTRSVDMASWLAFGELGPGPVPDPAAAAQAVAAYVRARLGACATADLAGARVSYVLRSCMLPRGMLEGRLEVTYAHAGGRLEARLAGAFSRVGEGSFDMRATAALHQDGARPRIAFDTDVRGLGARGVRYTSRWRVSTLRRGGDCNAMDGTWSFGIAGASWVGSFEGLEMCALGCPRARRADFASAALAPRIALVMDGTRILRWTGADGAAGTYEMACDPG